MEENDPDVPRLSFMKALSIYGRMRLKPKRGLVASAQTNNWAGEFGREIHALRWKQLPDRLMTEAARNMPAMAEREDEY